MRGLRIIQSTQGLRQFVDLWVQISQFRLTTKNDTMVWQFTTDGKYSAKSAYRIQFTGAITDER
jgi:hypothetical protein